MNLWRRGELTDAAAEKLTSEEQRIDQELREHRAAEHANSSLSTAKTPMSDPTLLPSDRPIRVLIVEDNDKDAELMAAFVRREG